MSKILNLTFNTIEEYKVPNSQINQFFKTNIEKIRIYNTTDNFPSENPNKSDLFPIYKNILEKSDLKNYISMLCMISQKIHKITYKIKSKVIGQRINFNINEKFIKADLYTDISNAKESKNLFCLKLLFKYYPYFCKILYFFIQIFENFNWE